MIRWGIKGHDDNCWVVSTDSVIILSFVLGYLGRGSFPVFPDALPAIGRTPAPTPCSPGDRKSRPEGGLGWGGGGNGVDGL